MSMRCLSGRGPCQATCRRRAPFAGPARRRPLVFVVKAANFERGPIDDGDIVPGELDRLVRRDEEEKVVMDDEMREACRQVDEFAATYAEELLAEALLVEDGDELSSEGGIGEKAHSALESLLESSSESVLAVVGDDVEEAEGVEDMQGPEGFRRYDEQEESGMSEETREKISAYKLSKSELANLVPEDWDTINVDWFTDKKETDIELPKYRLNFIWAYNNIAVAVDQVYSRGQISPLTEFFFWPRKDAWDDLRMSLETRPWISERERVTLLNETTNVINFWQGDGFAPSVDEARAAFPQCSFIGSDSPAPVAAGGEQPPADSAEPVPAPEPAPVPA